MASNTFNLKTLNPKPPDKGSFPIDHENVCKDSMIKYLRCLKDNNFLNEKCLKSSQDYLECRMDKGLMLREPWEKLGFKEMEIDSKKT